MAGVKQHFVKLKVFLRSHLCRKARRGASVVMASSPGSYHPRLESRDDSGSVALAIWTAEKRREADPQSGSLLAVQSRNVMVHHRS